MYKEKKEEYFWNLQLISHKERNKDSHKYIQKMIDNKT